MFIDTWNKEGLAYITKNEKGETVFRVEEDNGAWGTDIDINELFEMLLDELTHGNIKLN